jgi:hypothetical protein
LRLGSPPGRSVRLPTADRARSLVPRDLPALSVSAAAHPFGSLAHGVGPGGKVDPRGERPHGAGPVVSAALRDRPGPPVRGDRPARSPAGHRAEYRRRPLAVIGGNADQGRPLTALAWSVSLRPATKVK